MSFFFSPQDSNYTSPLVIPPLGIELRTKVYVQVQATNLTAQYDSSTILTVQQLDC